MKSWNNIVYSNNINKFEEQLFEFKEKYNSDNNIITYIEDTQINNYKEKFIIAYTNNYLHFSSTSSSRVEGAYSIIKKYLLVSTSNIDTVYIKLELTITN